MNVSAIFWKRGPQHSPHHIFEQHCLRTHRTFPLFGRWSRRNETQRSIGKVLCLFCIVQPHCRTGLRDGLHRRKRVNACISKTCLRQKEKANTDNGSGTAADATPSSNSLTMGENDISLPRSSNPHFQYRPQGDRVD